MSVPVVFAGPSIHAVNPARLHGIDLRPPAGRGDFLAAALEGVAVIGLIDGTFEFGAATWHKEILFALDRGIAVYGAASMGALRAAECAAFGMIGVGSIYADYATGRRQSDADVAIVHAPAALSYRPLTEALVDIDATLVQLQAQQILGDDIVAALSQSAVAMHFKERSWPNILANAGHDDPVLLELIGRHKIGAKTIDALALIDAVQHAAVSPRSGSLLPTAFNKSLFFTELEADVRRRKAFGMKE